ncbi:MAG TPA: hypothetical protein VF041_03170 [Gemmatimonadaceae bacterium]
MSVFSVLVFLHVVGALALFAGIAMEGAGLAYLRRATTTARMREWVGFSRLLGRIARPAVITIFVTGIYLAVTRWGHQAWIGLGFLGLVAIGVLGSAVTRRRVGAIEKALPAGDGPIPSALRGHLLDPVLRMSLYVRAALVLGIVFVMSVKPGTVGALVAMGVALALGVVLGRAGRSGDARGLATGRFEAES